MGSPQPLAPDSAARPERDRDRPPHPSSSSAPAGRAPRPPPGDFSFETSLQVLLHPQTCPRGGQATSRPVPLPRGSQTPRPSSILLLLLSTPARGQTPALAAATSPAPRAPRTRTHPLFCTAPTPPRRRPVSSHRHEHPRNESDPGKDQPSRVPPATGVPAAPATTSHRPPRRNRPGTRVPRPHRGRRRQSRKPGGSRLRSAKHPLTCGCAGGGGEPRQDGGSAERPARGGGGPGSGERPHGWQGPVALGPSQCM